MEEIKRKVVWWDIEAKKQLQEIFRFISSDSISAAIKIKNDILSLVHKLPEQPEVYPPDKFKSNNDGNYRAFEKHRYRIAYKITEKNILILRLCHTSREPLLY
mgnify:CR=1 FL=1